MEIIMLYRPMSEHSRVTEEYMHEFERTQRIPIEALSVETIEGAEKARLYDIVRYPALLVVRDNGELMKSWQDDKLPLMNEVVGYAR